MQSFASEDSTARDAIEITRKVEKLGLPGPLFPSVTPPAAVRSVIETNMLESVSLEVLGARGGTAEAGRTAAAAAGLAEGKPSALSPTGRLPMSKAGTYGSRRAQASMFDCKCKRPCPMEGR